MLNKRNHASQKNEREDIVHTREGIVITAAIREEFIVSVLLRIVLRAEEQHVLEEVRQTLEVRGVVVRADVHEEGRGRLAQAIIILILFVVFVRTAVIVVVVVFLVTVVVIKSSASHQRLALSQRQGVADQDAFQSIAQGDVSIQLLVAFGSSGVEVRSKKNVRGGGGCVAVVAHCWWL